MNSSSVETQRVGAQRPTHLLTPEGRFDFTDGDVACDLADALGLHLLEWQRWLVRWILATDENGKPACNTVIVIVPRQNGKGAILEALELFWLLVARIPVVIHTAHEADTAAGHMERIESLTAEPDIEIPRVKTFKSNGKERTKNLDDQLVLQYRTRTKATKRGASPQRVVLDECQELQNAHLAALVPSMAAQSMDPDKLPQLIYTGSAPLEHSHYMHDLLRRVQENRPARTLLAMWACDESDDIHDVENWYRTNPSLGVLISEEWIRDTELNALDPEDFAAERMGVPKGGRESTDDLPIDPLAFAQLTDGNSQPTSGVRLCLDAPPDRSRPVFAVAGVRSDGLTHVAVRHRIERQPNLTVKAQVVDAAKQLCKQYDCDLILPPGSPARAWLGDLLAAGVDVDELSSADYAEGCGAIVSAIADGTLRHRGQADMNEAVAGLAVKPSGDVDVWSRRKASVNISPFVAATCALVRVPEKSEQTLKPMFAAT